MAIILILYPKCESLLFIIIFDCIVHECKRRDGMVANNNSTTFYHYYAYSFRKYGNFSKRDREGGVIIVEFITLFCDT